MKIEHHHDIYHHHDPQFEAWQRRVNDALCLIIDHLEAIMATIQELQAAVTRNTDAENSVIVLLEGISQQLKEAKASGDPAAIEAVISQLDSNTARLGAAVVANTPAAPA